MVAFTSTQFFPYPVGSDRPCDMPDAWCDFAAQLDTELCALDTTFGRLTPAVPAARITRETDIVLTSTAIVPVPFESVSYDTDNMADLLQNEYLITAQRPGTWYAAADVMISGVTSGDVVLIYISLGFVPATGATGLSAAVSDEFRAPASGNYFLRTSGHAILNPTLANEGLQFGVALQANNINVTVGRANLAVHWANDRINNL